MDWITTDDELWGYDPTEEYLWMPEYINGLLTFTLHPRTFTFEGDERSFTFLAEDNEFCFEPVTQEFTFVANPRYFTQQSEV